MTKLVIDSERFLLFDNAPNYEKYVQVRCDLHMDMTYVEIKKGYPIDYKSSQWNNLANYSI